MYNRKVQINVDVEKLTSSFSIDCKNFRTYRYYVAKFHARDSAVLSGVKFPIEWTHPFRPTPGCENAWKFQPKHIVSIVLSDFPIR